MSRQAKICCPKCSSSNVRRDFFRRVNVGCMLVNTLALATFLERPNHFARVCRDCGHRFVN